LLVDIAAQLLFFDAKQQIVVSTYPIVLEHIDVFGSEPDAEQKLNAVRNVLLGTGENGLFGYTAKSLVSATPSSKDGARLGVRNVQVTSDALAAFPASMQKDPRRAATMLAQDFTRFLAKSQQVAVLPYVKGDAIGNRMATRLANGQVFNLAIPEPDFAFDLTLERLKKVQYGQSAAGTSWIYGSLLRIALTEPLSGKQYLDASFKNGETKSVPVTQTVIDDWPSYHESISGLLTKLTIAMGDPKDPWAQRASDN